MPKLKLLTKLFVFPSGFTYPVDKNKLGKVGIRIRNSAVGVLNFATV